MGDIEKEVQVSGQNRYANEGNARERKASEKLLKHSHDADEALKAVQGHEGGPVVIDEETNRRILRRIDFNLIPIMCVVYGKEACDRRTSRLYALCGCASC